MASRSRPSRSSPRKRRAATSPAQDSAELRRQLVRMLRGDGAHLKHADVLRRFPPAMASKRATGHRHTAWQLIEHMRIAQWDMLEYTRTPGHVSPEFPEGYWPPTATPPDTRAWGRSVQAFQRDLAAMERLVQRSRDVCAPIAHAGGVSLLREALLVADHNAYHLGQLVSLQKAIEA